MQNIIYLPLKNFLFNIKLEFDIFGFNFCNKTSFYNLEIMHFQYFSFSITISIILS